MPPGTSGPPPSVPKNPSKLGRVHFPVGDIENGSQTPRRAGKQIATAPEDGPDDLRSFLANAELQLTMGDVAQHTQQFPAHFAHVPHLYDRAQSVTPKPTVRPVPRMASKLSSEVEAPQEVTRTDSYLFAIMQTTRSESTPQHSGGVQVIDPRSFTVDDDARSFQSPYQAPFGLPDFRPPPLGANPSTSQTSLQSLWQPAGSRTDLSANPSASQSSLQSLWQSAGSRTDLSSSEQKSPKSDEMVVIASDEGDSDWEASGFDKDELERMIETEMNDLHSETSTVVPELQCTTSHAPKASVEDVSVPGAFSEEPEEPKTKGKGAKTKKKEEARRREEEVKRKVEEAKRKEEEARRRVEDAKRKEEEAHRKDEERRRMEEKRRIEEEEEAKRKEEARRKKEADAARSKPTTAQARRAAAAEEKKKAEAQRKLEAERRRLEETKLAEEEERAEEERLRAEEQKRREAEALEQRLGEDKLAAFIKQQEAWNKAEMLRKPEDKQRALEEERARQRELEKQRLEEEKRKQEEAALAERIGKEKLEAFMKQQEEVRRRLEGGRPRTDSLSRTPSAELVKPPVVAAKEQTKKVSEPQARKRNVTFAEEDPKDREARLAAVEDMHRRREDELRSREEELRRREDELRRRESEGEDRKRKPGAPQLKADELRVKERQLARQAEENQKKEQELRKREDALHRYAEDMLSKMKVQQEEFRRQCLMMGMPLSK